MFNNHADDVYEGEAAITRARDLIMRGFGEGLSDQVLDDIWSTHSFDAGDSLTIHVDHDPLGRVWTLRTPDLTVSRMRPARQAGEDLVFFGDPGIRQGIYTFMSGHGEDDLLTMLSVAGMFAEGDKFTIHYHDRTKAPSWTLETADNLIFKKPKYYMEPT